MRYRMKCALGAAALAMIGLATSALAEGTTIVEGIGDQWQSLDPQFSSASKDAQILGDLYEGLVGLTVDGQPAPGAAESWDVSPDGLVYTFHLRAGLKWSNGDPLVAQDFVNGMQRQLDPATGSYKAYYLFTQLPVTGAADFNAKTTTDFATVGIKAPDDRTVVIHLDAPNPNALILLGFYVTSPLHKPSLDQFGTEFVTPEHFVGNGAYMMKELVPQSHVLLVKNPNYWDAASVKVDNIRYVVTEDVHTEFKQYRSDEIQITWDVPTEALEQIRKEFGDQLRIAPYAASDYISFNTQKPPLDDIRIRQALALALDRDVLVNKVARSAEIPIESFVPPVDPSYPALRPTIFTGDQKANLELAKKLMAEAGYGPDHPLTISYYCTSDDLARKKTEAISIMWQKALGVISRIKLQESQSYYEDFYKLEWDAYCDGLVGDYAGPEPFLVYRTKVAAAGYPWENAKYEEIMGKAIVEPDLAKRKALLVEAEQILLDDFPLAPLLQESVRRMISPRVKGWADNPIGYHLSKYLTLD